MVNAAVVAGVSPAIGKGVQRTRLPLQFRCKIDIVVSTRIP